MMTKINDYIIDRDIRAMNWLKHFAEVAKLVSTMSKDPAKKIGVVIVDKNKRIISTGFNGFPKGIKDTKDRLENKEYKRAITLHAEENAILYAKQDLSGCEMYIYGLPPCSHCAAMIIQSGISAVYYTLPKEYEISDHWKENLKIAEDILEEAKIPLLELNV